MQVVVRKCVRPSCSDLKIILQSICKILNIRHRHCRHHLCGRHGLLWLILLLLCGYVLRVPYGRSLREHVAMAQPLLDLFRLSNGRLLGNDGSEALPLFGAFEDEAIIDIAQGRFQHNGGTVDLRLHVSKHDGILRRRCLFIGKDEASSPFDQHISIFCLPRCCNRKRQSWFNRNGKVVEGELENVATNKTSAENH